MKKSKLLLLLSSILVLAGCSNLERYYPTQGGRYVPEPTEEEHGGGGQGEDEELQCTYNFYFSYSATTKYNPFTNKDEDAPILSFKHAMLKPLGAKPTEVDSEAKVKELGEKLGFTCDPTFPKFIGFSFNGVCLDETGLWNFETDYKQLAVVTLYGVWVSE